MIWNILLFALAGFVAQLIDGSLGMAYGVSSNTFLLTLGVPPAAASASVHTAEIFTTLTSGLSHLKLGNVKKDLVLCLLLPGVIGGVVGAYILVSLPTQIIKPLVSAYLLIMGVMILVKAFKNVKPNNKTPRPVFLALVGGFFDAVGGGGWGPVVTTTLLANGHEPRFMIGSVNLAEFFVTTAETIMFIATIGSTLMQNWETIVGLLIGGVIAAPLGAYVTSKLDRKTLMIVVGLLITGLSIRTIVLALAG